jgi:hypothetical protein
MARRVSLKANLQNALDNHIPKLAANYEYAYLIKDLFSDFPVVNFRKLAHPFAPSLHR